MKRTQSCLLIVIFASATAALWAQQPSAALWAQQPSAAMQLYARVRSKVLEGLRSLPRYTCVETITRSYHKPPQPPRDLAKVQCEYLAGVAAKRADQPFVAWDRLRLDVTMSKRVAGSTKLAAQKAAAQKVDEPAVQKTDQDADDPDGDADDDADAKPEPPAAKEEVIYGEMYSWVGAPHFEDSLFDLVGGLGRPLVDGDFGSVVGGVLLNSARVDEAGETQVDGKRLLQFKYDVPEFRSRFAITSPQRSVITAYSGTMLIDPATEDLVRVTLRTDILSKEAGICRMEEESHYSRKQIGSDSALTPDLIRLNVISNDGSDSENLAVYSNCRQYAGESTISFDDVDVKLDDNGRANAATGPLVIPAGQRIRVRVVTPIDSDTAAAGDAVEGVLSSPIRDENRKVIVPTGTKVRGRLALLLQVAEPRTFYEVGVRLESLLWNGQPVDLKAMPIVREETTLPDLRTDPRPGLQANIKTNSRPNVRETFGYLANLPKSVNVFTFETGHLRLKQLDSDWLTQ